MLLVTLSSTKVNESFTTHKTIEELEGHMEVEKREKGAIIPTG